MFAPKSWPSVISVYDDWDLTRFFKLNEDREVFPGGVSAAIVRFEGTRTSGSTFVHVLCSVHVRVRVA